MFLSVTLTWCPYTLAYMIGLLERNFIINHVIDMGSGRKKRQY